MIVALLFGGINTKVYAGEGDFYKRNKDTFKSYENMIGKVHIEQLIKKYDFETNSFNCGTFDIYCNSRSLTYSGIVGASSFASESLKFLIRDPDMIIKDKGLSRFKGYMTTLSRSLLPLFLIWHMMVMALRRMGDPDDYHQAMNQKMLGVFGGAMFLGLYDKIFDMIFNIQNDMLRGIIKETSNAEAFAVMVFSWGEKYSQVVMLLLVLAMAIFGMIIMYRFVALSFMFMIGPLAIATILNDEFNYFSIWWKYIWNSLVTFLLQAIAYTYCIQVLTGQNAYIRSFPLLTQPPIAMSMAFVITMFALTIPSLLGNLGNSSGTGRSIGKVARMMVLKR